MPCTHPNSSPLYGLGIRLSLYILWPLIITADLLLTRPSIPYHLVPKARRTTNQLKSFTFIIELAIFIALILQTVTSQTVNALNIDVVDLYILFLLSSGRLFLHIPIYGVKLLGCCLGNWDMGRLRGEWYDVSGQRYRIGENPIWMGLRFGYLVGVCGWGAWFWTGGLDGVGRDGGCVRYGFLFGRVELAYEGMVVWHVIVVVCLLVGAVVALLGYVGREMNGKKRFRCQEPLRSVFPVPIHLPETDVLRLTTYNNLRYLRFFSHAVVAGTVIAAIELTIQYNSITNIYDVSTSAQLIPLVCAIVVAIWLLLECVDISRKSGPGWDWWYWTDGDYTSSDTDDTRSTRSGRSRRRGPRIPYVSPERMIGDNTANGGRGPRVPGLAHLG